MLFHWMPAVALRGLLAHEPRELPAARFLAQGNAPCLLWRQLSFLGHCGENSCGRRPGRLRRGRSSTHFARASVITKHERRRE